MKRLALLPFLAVIAACPSDKRRAERVPVDSAKADSLRADTATKTDLSGVTSSMPAVAPDTFKARKLPIGGVGSGSGPTYAEAPPMLHEAVQREESFSRFCYTEFGQKSDPSLRGSVLMVVSVSANGVDDARVYRSNWSGSAGGAVNRCLNDKAKRAWKVAPGSVKKGKYSVQLSFTGQ